VQEGKNKFSLILELLLDTEMWIIRSLVIYAPYGRSKLAETFRSKYDLIVQGVTDVRLHTVPSVTYLTPTDWPLLLCREP